MLYKFRTINFIDNNCHLKLFLLFKMNFIFDIRISLLTSNFIGLQKKFIEAHCSPYHFIQVSKNGKKRKGKFEIELIIHGWVVVSLIVNYDFRSSFFLLSDNIVIKSLFFGRKPHQTCINMRIQKVFQRINWVGILHFLNTSMNSHFRN